MNFFPVELELAESHLREWLSSMGLDVEYVRAEGNTLYRLDGNNQEIPILDYAGGYGSLILGHNNPDIVAHAKALLEAQTPVHAQFSRHPYANQVATALNRIVQRELSNDEPYSVIFANSGAEAIEVAIKHAELDRVFRVSALSDEIDFHVEEARSTVWRCDAVVSDDAYNLLGVSQRAASVDGFEKLISELLRKNSEQLSRPPLLLALEGSFHGKLMGSVQLTHNVVYRTPFKALAAQARFVPVDQPEVLKKIIEDERSSLLDVVVDDGVVRIQKREFPIFTAFVLEPIQGEGGINVITQKFAGEIQQACEAVDCPIVVDEIQSGMGRCGAFLASSLVGLRGDYYALAKSLGGGLAKASVILVRKTRYRPEFEFIHSSTFAKDSFSCFIALKVLEILEADSGRAYQLAEERGSRLTAMLNAVRADFPDVVKDVRGKGLMLGLEFQDQSQATSAIIRDRAESGFLGYVIAGYLLREHSIRIFPTASSANTLRFEPSIYLSDAEIAQLESGLRTACSALRSQDGQRLVQT